jgi:hypothetical protein
MFLILTRCTVPRMPPVPGQETTSKSAHAYVFFQDCQPCAGRCDVLTDTRPSITRSSVQPALHAYQTQRRLALPLLIYYSWSLENRGSYYECPQSGYSVVAVSWIERKQHFPEVIHFMKLIVHAYIFSVVFAGILAGAVTTKPTVSVPENHSLVVSHAMPVPSCPPSTGCGLYSNQQS